MDARSEATAVQAFSAPAPTLVATFICLVIGHSWADPRAIGTDSFGVSCNRCQRGLVGDWDEIERNGAWEHYRSF